MPRRHILTKRQRHALLALPTEEASLLKHYTLAEDDLEHIGHRRQRHNRLGFALQLCALRYPGRLLSPGEVIPHEVLRFLAAQLGLKADDQEVRAESSEQRRLAGAALPHSFPLLEFTLGDTEKRLNVADAERLAKRISALLGHHVDLVPEVAVK